MRRARRFFALIVVLSAEVVTFTLHLPSGGLRRGEGPLRLLTGAVCGFAGATVAMQGLV